MKDNGNERARESTAVGKNNGNIDDNNNNNEMTNHEPRTRKKTPNATAVMLL